ncbi:MAG TPA: sulfatase [Acidimicrobiia bacterium]|nr:sulfatase [Acidimicrobiia bacterium]
MYLRARALVVPLAMLLVVASLCTAAGASTNGPSRQESSGKRPNIVLILADDLDRTQFLDPSRFPKVNSLLVDEGTTFSNYFVTDSLCCPSRSSILRGQYVHNHDVRSNKPPLGGFEKFHTNGDESSTIATWLHDAGYRTGLLGKYLNGYPNGAGETFVPPGWDTWASPVRSGGYSGYNYRLNENGTLVPYGANPQDYMTDVLSRKSGEFIQQSGDKPFLLYVAPFVPHSPATPAPRHADTFPGVQAPRTASFNQADVSAEPQWLRDRPLLDDQQIASIDALYRKQLQSMLAVEDLIEHVVDTLRRTGELDNTYIALTSDNGFHLGQHRLPQGKITAFEEDIRVPLVVRGPGVPAGKRVDDFGANIDLAPTLADVGDAKAPSFVDGRSLAPALRGKTGDDARTAVLVEHFVANDRNGRTGRRGGVPPTYAAVRTDRYTYVEYVTGERQLYDLRTDPDQLHNIVSTAEAKLVADLAGQLSSLRTCEARACRAADRR